MPCECCKSRHWVDNVRIQKRCKCHERKTPDWKWSPLLPLCKGYVCQRTREKGYALEERGRRQQSTRNLFRFLSLLLFLVFSLTGCEQMLSKCKTSVVHSKSENVQLYADLVTKAPWSRLHPSSFGAFRLLGSLWACKSSSQVCTAVFKSMGSSGFTAAVRWVFGTIPKGCAPRRGVRITAL